MTEDHLIEAVLGQFINCHEQTYEEFLSTFSHLSKEDAEAKSRGSQPHSSENELSSIKFVNKQDINDQSIRSKDSSPHSDSHCSEEEQIVMDEGQRVGVSVQGIPDVDRGVKVDNYLDLEDFDSDEESGSEMSTEPQLLPGEVEQEIISVPGYVPSSHRHPLLDVRTRPTVRQSSKQTEELPGDEVQPFSLDEQFDYDNVMLTPKITTAEMEAITALSRQKKVVTDVVRKP
ncbi:intraflagellar transport-associated protein [Tachyglossus aculeatus]|uniref:intraflagellar transport-associated protein n=1 Tax=Tachyglossus aculeatus TaxID=9261 RepID=UPI0018F27F6D|nr:intraflagellar transport-associated protein [Tachyglossus aculeatus]